jgi:O-acetylserine/cysteine efflux transporter
MLNHTRAKISCQSDSDHNGHAFRRPIALNTVALPPRILRNNFAPHSPPSDIGIILWLCLCRPLGQVEPLNLFHQLIALVVTLIWGTNFVFIRYGLDELAPFTFAALRFLLVAFPLVLIFPRPNSPWRYLISYGLFIGFGQFGLLFWAMQANISPGLASLIIQMQVFFTILLAVVFAQERLNLSQVLALVVCFCGLLTIIVFTDAQTTSIGVAVTLVAAASWSAGNLIVKGAGKVDILAFIAWSSMFAVPPLAAMAWYFEGPAGIYQDLLDTSWRGWAVVFWQSIGNTLIGYGLWNMLLSRYSAATVAPWALLVPVFGMSASAMLLDESMPWWKLLAMGLIFGGLALNMLAVRK